MRALSVAIETMIVLDATVGRMSGAPTIRTSLLWAPRIYRLLLANPIVSGSGSGSGSQQRITLATGNAHHKRPLPVA